MTGLDAVRLDVPVTPEPGDAVTVRALVTRMVPPGDRVTVLAILGIDPGPGEAVPGG